MWRKQQSKNQKNGPKKIHSQKKAQNSASPFSSSKSLSSTEKSSKQQQKIFGQYKQTNKQKYNNKNTIIKQNNAGVCQYWMKGICKNSHNCEKKHYQITTIDQCKNLQQCNTQQINKELQDSQLILITTSITQLATIEQLQQMIQQNFEGKARRIQISYKNNKNLKKMMKEKINNQKNQNINREERKVKNLQIISKYLPLINKDTKEENAQKIVLSKQNKLEKKKIKKLQKQMQYDIVSEIDENDIEIEDNKQNTSQQDQLQQNQLNYQQQYVQAPQHNQQYQQNQYALNNENKVNAYHQSTYYQLNQQQQPNEEPFMSRYIQNLNTKAPDTNMQTQGPISQILKAKLQQTLQEIRKSRSKQIRDGQDNENITQSSRESSAFNNSNELETTINRVNQNEKIYDLQLIINTKSYRNNDLQHLISLNDIALDFDNKGKFIRGATFDTNVLVLKEKYQKQFIQLAKQVGRNKTPLMIIYDQLIWEKKIMEQYIQIARINHIEILKQNDQQVKTEFKKLITLINRYIKRVINIPIRQQQINQKVEIKVIEETPTERQHNIEWVTQLIIKLLENKTDNIDAITYQLNGDTYSVYFINGQIL